MRQMVISAGGIALLALLVSGCSLSALRPAPASAAVASVAAAPSSAATATADEAKPTDDLSMVTAFAAPIVPGEEAGQSAQESTVVPLAVAFASAGAPPPSPAEAVAAPARVTGLDGLITHYSMHYSVPERLVRRIIVRESGYNAAARNGPYYGLMQISHATARGMGFSGAAGGLLDAETNLRYAVKYLRGAYLVAQGNEDRAVRFYASGYYYDAKRMGLLEEVGMR